MRAVKVLFLLVLIGALGWACYTYLLPALSGGGEAPVARSDRNTGLSCYEKGDYEGAAGYLKNEASKPGAGPEVLLPLGKSLVELGRGKEAAKHLERVVTEHGASKESEEALYLLGSIATDDAAKTSRWSELLKKNYRSEWAGAAAPSLGDTLYAQGKLFEAREAYSRALESRLQEKEREKIVEILTKINERLVFSKAATPDAITYTVKKGDTLDRIAKKYNTTAGLIKLVNGIKGEAGRIYEDQDLKVITSPVRVLVEVETFRLIVFLGNHWLKEYTVGVGKEGEETPVGRWKVTTMTPNPPWFRPGETIQNGDPRNILGTRWIGLSKKTYGIHGTTEPDSIGKPASKGCIRMLNSDVEELFELVKTGTEVEVR